MKRIALCLTFLALFVSGLQAQYFPPNSPSMAYIWGDSDAVCEYMFLGLFRFVQPANRRHTNLLLNRKGETVWYQQDPAWMLDFKLHPNGVMTYHHKNRWVILDSTFSLVDTLRCVGNLNSDVHDIQITADGHYFLLCYEDSTMDLRSITTRNGTPGDSAARVVANVVQELDPSRNVVREWHAFPHFSIYDSDNQYFIYPNFLDLTHTNSIEIGPDGRMLLSHRHTHEVTMLDWPTGQILWRLGGTQNQFSFPNDIGIDSQHDARFLPDGRVSIFDNGTYHQPPRARGLIYTIDTATMTATLDWEFHVPGLHSQSLGSFRVMPNGDGLVNFGETGSSLEPKVYYVRQDCSRVLDIKFMDTYWTYRAQCFELPFQIPRPEIICTQQGGVTMLSVSSTHSSYQWNTGDVAATIAIQDTGNYQVFVPYGVGMLGSEVFHVADVNNPCGGVGMPEPSGAHVPDKLLGTFDVLGRPVSARQPGQLYIERTRSGARKVVLWD